MVRVEDAFPPGEPATEEGLNDAVAPDGNTEVMLKGEVQVPGLPLKFTVMVYVAELPATTGLGDCAPTVTLCGFASVKVPVTETAEVKPTAV